MLDSRTNKLLNFAVLVFLGLCLAACGSEQPQPPVASSLSLTTAEETPVSNKLSATSPQGDALTFELAFPPQHGDVQIDSATGQFTYAPERDYTGEDSFAFSARAGNLASQPQYVRITLTPVNDPPVLAAIPTMTNSAETLIVTYKLPAMDVDGDRLQVSATVDDSSIATVTSDDGELTVSILPVARGATNVHVTVRDSEYSAAQSFVFGVGDVTKWRRISANMANGEAIAFTNTTSESMNILFEHNGFPLFQSDDEIVQYVKALPAQFPGEPFERKLWRFVRDSSYHNVPLTAEQWLHDTWAVVVAQGWGLCSHMSAAYVQLARAAGYQARVWGLTGHVVAEIKIDDRWQIFDPDLALYYYTADLTIASVEDIENDPNLIVDPVNPVLPSDVYSFEYKSMVADIYASSDDNFIGDDIFLSEEPRQYQPLSLPPGARLEYPGRWTQSVMGVNGTTPLEIPYYLQSRLSTQAGWTGTIVLPWMIWEIRGNGRVRVRGQDFDVGSASLQALLQEPGEQIPEIEVLSATSELQFISFINAMRYALDETNSVALRGMNVWAVDIQKTELPEEFRANATGKTTFQKPSP
jgi:hypothetical protein